MPVTACCKLFRSAKLLLLVPMIFVAGTVHAKTVHIAGDSTASNYGADVFPRMGWGQALADFYSGEHRVNNLAQGGRSSRSFIDEGFFAELESAVAEGDLVLIQFGHNDAKDHSPERYTSPDGEYQAFLMRYVAMARAKKATPVLLTSIVRRKFEAGKLVPTHGDYPAAMRALASAEDVALIDLNQLSRQWVNTLGEEASKLVYLQQPSEDGPIEDNSHFSQYGAYRLAAMVAQSLDQQGLLPLDLPTPRFLRVEQDGSGDTTRIQDALDKLAGSDDPAVILVGEGVFDEQLFMTRDNVAIVGKGRDKTTIKTSLLRANWRRDHTDDWGASTINIKASDLSFLQLRVVNDYGIVRGDHSHQFALRLLSGTRILSEDSTFITGGADTVSLWNKDAGMYYHRRAYFEGYTDFVCPRGWSYITDSTFFSRGGAAAIWHDGERAEDQKLVIKNSSFDGIENFILGRRHYDAQFYLINNRYSENLADLPIFRVTYDDPEKNRANLWGDRAYYFGSQKAGQAYAWLDDNISADQAQISASDTFGGRWDPEARLAQIKAQVALFESPLRNVKHEVPNTDAPVALRMASQHIERFPKPWLMRKSDGAYVWSYTHGLVLMGMQRLAAQVPEAEAAQLRDYAKAYADHFIDESGNIESLHLTEFNIDSINAGNILFELYADTGDARYKSAMAQLRTQLRWQPRTNSGGFWHKRKYPWQIWLDGLYMAHPFYVRYASEFESAPAVYEDSVQQFVRIEKETRDSETGLLYHAWDESKLQPWADPKTGRAPGFWSRAMGWYAMALVDTYEHLPADHPGRESLAAILERLVTALAPYQHQSGLWYQVPDQGHRADNWLEASGSAMFVYAMAKGVRLSMLDSGYLPIAERGYQGLLNELISVEDGVVHLNNVCRSAGLGGEPYRSGSYEYYVTTDRVRDDAHGIGAFLLAASEMLVVEQSGDSSLRSE